MSPSEVFIRRPVATTLLTIALVFFGVLGYTQLPVSDLPSVDYPTIQVSAYLPGASPETMASAVAAPLERNFSDIAGISAMSSKSSLGSTTITVQFHLNRNIDAAAQDIQAAISRAQLPSNLPQAPSYQKVNPSASPIFYLSLQSAALPISRVNEFATTLISRRISTITGVAQVLIYGEQKYAVRVQLDPKRLANRMIGLEEVVAAVRRANTDLPTGFLENAYQAMTVSTDGQLKKAALYRPVIVAVRQGRPVRLEELGRVVAGVETERAAAFWRGEKSIVMAVQRQPGANTIEVVNAIRAMLPMIKRQLPPSVKMEVLFDASRSVRESVTDVKFTLLAAVSLVILVVFLFLKNFSATLITSLAVPTSLIATFALMHLLGYSLDNLSLMALTLSVGFVVDDAIVMLENIYRHMQMGKSPWRAALDGAREIGFTIISMTLSLVVVFLPVLLMSGMLGRLLSEFAVTISAAIIISGLVSLSLTPMLASRFLREPGKAQAEGDRVYRASLKAYESMLNWVMAHRRTTMAAFLVILGLTVHLFAVIPKGFIPSQDRGLIIGYGVAQQGISFPAMKKLMTRAAAIMKRDPAIHGVMPVVGSQDSMNHGIFFMRLKERDKRKAGADQVIARMRGKVNQLPGLMVFLMNPPPITLGARGGMGGYQYTIIGTSINDLYPAAMRLAAAMRRLPQIRDVNSDLMIASPQVAVALDRDKAAVFGISPELVEQTLQYAFSAFQASTINATSDQYKVIVELLPRFRREVGDLSWIWLRSQSGDMVPLNAVVKSTPGLAALTVNHTGQLPSVTISFNLAAGHSLDEATGAVRRAAAGILPGTVSGSFQGEAQAFESSMVSLVVLLILALAVIYFILGILYESFIHPLTILAGLPSAALGALVTLGLFGRELDLYGFVGIILLVGIVKKNAIMMIDFALDRERSEKVPPEKAIVEAALARYRPIMMTTIAAFMGILPIALGLGAGGDSRQPLGLAVCGGLALSQLITLLITPVIYTYLDKLRTLGRKNRQPVETEC